MTDGSARIESRVAIGTFHDLLVALSGAVSATEVSDVFLSQGRELVGADAAAVATWSSSGTSLEMLGITGFDDAVVERFQRFDLSVPTPMSEAVSTGTPVFVEAGDEVQARYPHLPVTGRAFAAAPARGRNGVNGAISFRFPEGRALDENLRSVIAALGEHFGLALDRAELFEAAEAEQERLLALMQQLPVGVAIAEAPSGRIVAVNARATEIWRVEPFSGPISDVSDVVAFHPDGRRYAPEDWPIARSLATGEVVEAEEVDAQFGDGTRGWVSISARPVTNRDGRLIGAVTTLVDVTEPRRREAEARFMADAAEVLVESLDPEETLRRLAYMAVPRLADWCAVYVLEGNAIRTVTVAHTDPAKVSLAQEFAQRYPTDPEGGGVGRVIRTGRSELTEHITREMIEAAAPDEEFVRAIYDELGLRSVVTVPLQARDERIGAVVLVAAESGRKLGKRDQAFAEHWATHAALAVSNARLFTQQLEIADTLQRSLLPIRLPDFPGLEIATAYWPAGRGVLAGGDFFDVWQIGDESSFGLAIGDVAGKGAPAAALTALARHTARTASLTLPTHSPAEVIRQVNDGILRRAGAGRLCTLATAYGVRSGPGFDLVIGCAGHQPPLIARADGTVETHGVPGTLLGLTPDIDTPEHRTQLMPGDLFFMWTDGLDEHRRAGEFFGEDRVADLLREHHGGSPAELIERVEQAVQAFSPDRPRDDIALLAVKAVETA